MYISSVDVKLQNTILISSPYIHDRCLLLPKRKRYFLIHEIAAGDRVMKSAYLSPP